MQAYLQHWHGKFLSCVILDPFINVLRECCHVLLAHFAGIRALEILPDQFVNGLKDRYSLEVVLSEPDAALVFVGPYRCFWPQIDPDTTRSRPKKWCGKNELNIRATHDFKKIVDEACNWIGRAHWGNQQWQKSDKKRAAWENSSSSQRRRQR